MKNNQTGFGVLHVIAIIVILLIGAAVWKQHLKNEKDVTRIAEVEQRKQADAAKATAAENQKKLEAEKRAFEEKSNKEATKSEYEKSIAALGAIHARWIDTVKLAESTSRVALSTPLASLQQIKRDTDSLLVPDCYTAKKTALVAHMESTIEAFIAFLSNSGDLGTQLARIHFESASKHLNDYVTMPDTCPKDERRVAMQ